MYTIKALIIMTIIIPKKYNIYQISYKFKITFEAFPCDVSSLTNETRTQTGKPRLRGIWSCVLFRSSQYEISANNNMELELACVPHNKISRFLPLF